MTSIRRWLLGWLIFGFAAASVVAGYAIFRTAHEEASELFDYELHAVAVSLPPGMAATDALAQGPAMHDLSDDRIAIDVWDAQGQLVYRSEGSLDIAPLAEGFRTIERHDKHWRVFGLRQPGRFIQVAQPVSVREALALRLALRTLWPLGLLLPLTVALVLFVVTRGLAPIRALSRMLSTRSLEALEPVRFAGPVPVEMLPLVDALNDLLSRLNAASSAQRTFVADAAHELRSPLTALKLQLQAAQRNGSLQGEGDTVRSIEARLNRIIRLVQQLLTLARQDAESSGTALAPVALRRIAEQAVSDFSLLAEAKSIDLGLEVAPPAREDDAFEVYGEPNALSVLLNNLLDNAIKHTPPAGRVDVVLCRGEQGVSFEVRDTGPGIAEAELSRVCDRFYRGTDTQGEGSGLGLAIAQRVANRHRAHVTLRNNAEGQGLTVTVSPLRPVMSGSAKVRAS
ncbi:two-component sensor histidine kinase [Trinickia dabaoshanensis]|uniref:histidine kinase n=1 Tax=Trinickia dabaoshanensis TaxID=564714 RepID=A0A2N7VX11_9BURK|nr:ATP-binding protein [Trinickia dabaoshanensis]PMS21686.1 two-component sensor histidine kinase [Trinickia dabaoshanensis]